MKAFISHSMDETEQANFAEMCAALKGAQLDHWNPAEIAAGQPLPDKLREAVAVCAVCVFIATKRSIASTWCQAELGAFWGAGKPVILFVADKTIGEKELPQQFVGDKRAQDLREVITAVRVHFEAAERSERDLRNPLAQYNRDSRALDAVKASGLRDASQEIWMIGATMPHTFGNNQTVLVERLAAGVELNLLIADPTGSQFGATAATFGQTTRSLDLETRITLEGVLGVAARLSQQGLGSDRFNVRLVDVLFTAGAYFFDPKSAAGRMILVPHVPGHDAAEVPGLVFQPKPNGPLEDYLEVYKGVWKRGVPFKDWVDAHRSYLA